MPNSNTPASGKVYKKMNKWAAINNDVVNGIQGVAYFFKSKESAKRFSRKSFASAYTYGKFTVVRITGTINYKIAK
jgi:hypothetical protein